MEPIMGLFIYIDIYNYEIVSKNYLENIQLADKLILIQE
jgi:hypothetical protein